MTPVCPPPASDCPAVCRPRIVSWFSCGTASAVATKLALAKYRATHEMVIGRCLVPEEHADNDLFAAECQNWFEAPILCMKSTEYASCEDVWTRKRYMSGVEGAACTLAMKKAVRQQFERDWLPDFQVFGFTADEAKRAKRFAAQNPDVRMLTPLIDAGLSKEDCHAIVDRAGITLPYMYRIGFDNANCIGCVNAQGATYWNRTRKHFPEVFAARAALSRKLGVRLIKGSTGDRERQFLDELDPAAVGDEPPGMECSLLCYIAEQVLT
jgi:hypothetical protein